MKTEKKNHSENDQSSSEILGFGDDDDAAREKNLLEFPNKRCCLFMFEFMLQLCHVIRVHSLPLNATYSLDVGKHKKYLKENRNLLFTRVGYLITKIPIFSPWFILKF